MNVGAACNRRIAMAEKSTSVFAAAKSMSAFDERMLVVTEKRNGALAAVGIVTDHELVAKVVALRADPLKLTVQDVMRRDHAFVMDTDGVPETIAWMRRNMLNEAIVHEKGGGVIGIVTLDGLADSLAGEGALPGVPAGGGYVQEPKSLH
jgi:signal-transduction protein with cAMP-binding, CBS, and nucleotidyltransferase domain